MDIPYKGHTIIPNSERQPDGRWLPVADLEANSRGVMTPMPPLRAMARETRATRAEADTVAVKMAKAWIEGNEHEGGAAPVLADASPVAPPRVVPEPRVQEARVKAPPRPRKADTLSWPRLYEAIGLDAVESVERFTRLLAVHSFLDRLVTLAVAKKLGDIETTLAATVALPLVSRVALAVALNVVSSAVAENILEIDRARNGLVNARPTRGKPAWDTGDAVDSIPQETLRKGLEAAQGLMSALH